MAIEVVGGTVDHLDPAEFDQLLTDHGTPALWRRARTCPCLDPRSGQAQLDCPVCLTEGVIWDAGQPSTILIPGRSRKDEYDQAGMWMQGFAQITFLSPITAGHFDRIDLQAAEMVVNNELHARGAVDRAGRSKERLRFRHALAVEFCETIIDGALVGFTLDTDFAIGASGEIQWVDGHGPDDGRRYSMRYRARPAWVCWSPRSREEGGQKMPYRVNAQRLDFFQRPVVGGE